MVLGLGRALRKAIGNGDVGGSSSKSPEGSEFDLLLLGADVPEVRTRARSRSWPLRARGASAAPARSLFSASRAQYRARRARTGGQPRPRCRVGPGIERQCSHAPRASAAAPPLTTRRRAAYGSARAEQPPIARCYAPLRRGSCARN
jgi:hypothetical protein